MINRIIPIVLLLAVPQFMVGCASQRKLRPPSEYLLSSDLNVAKSFEGIDRRLRSLNYKIETSDMAAGLLVFEPRRFSYKNSNQKAVARQSINARQEGGSIKITIVYDCSYEGGRFSPCRLNDSDLSARIEKLEPKIINSIKPALMKQGEDRAQSSDESEY